MFRAIVLSLVTLSLLGCAASTPDRPSAPVVVPASHQEVTLIGTIDKIDEGENGGDWIIFQGLDGSSNQIPTCDHWPVVAGRKYQIDAYHLYIESEHTYGTCYHADHVQLLN